MSKWYNKLFLSLPLIKFVRQTDKCCGLLSVTLFWVGTIVGAGFAVVFNSDPKI